jgi:hypothetical protein
VLLALPAMASDQIKNFSPINRDRVDLPTQGSPGDTPAVQALDDPVPYWEGNLKVYVVEHESSMNWHDGDGYLYDFPFLAFAINDDIHVMGQETWDTTVSWSGSAYGYNNLQEDNIAVQAVLFSSIDGYPEAAAMADPGVPGSNVVEAGYTHTVFAEEGTASW